MKRIYERLNGVWNRLLIVTAVVAVAGLLVPAGSATHHLDTQAGDGPHVHDHWDGRQQLSLIDRTVEADAVEQAIEFIPGDTTPNYRIRPPLRRDPGPGAAHIVPEGTSRMTIRLSWVGDAVGSPTVCAGPAESPCFFDGASRQFDQSGETWTIDNETVDSNGDKLLGHVGIERPHQPRSDWTFSVWLCASGRPGTAGCQPDPGIESFHIDVDLHRGDDTLTTRPGHRDVFENGSTHDVIPPGALEHQPFVQSNYATQLFSKLLDRRVPYLTVGDLMLHARDVDDPHVPWNTERLRVRLSWDTAVPVDMELGYLTAADHFGEPWRSATHSGVSCGPDCIEYVIPTDPFLSDSPYSCRADQDGDGEPLCFSEWMWAVFPANHPPRPLTDATIGLSVLAEGPI